MGSRCGCRPTSSCSKISSCFASTAPKASACIDRSSCSPADRSRAPPKMRSTRSIAAWSSRWRRNRSPSARSTSTSGRSACACPIGGAARAGLRGLRLGLAHPEILRTQLRALVRARAHGRLRVMFPFVTGVEEVRAGQSDARRDCRASCGMPAPPGRRDGRSAGGGAGGGSARAGGGLPHHRHQRSDSGTAWRWIAPTIACRICTSRCIRRCCG